jgi:hypothetical protein
MKKAIGIGFMALFLSAQALAETQSGVTVYPGARVDKETAEMLKKSMGIKGHTYRTPDSVEKVADFYRKQPLEENPGTSKTGAGFRGKKVMVTIQNPWMDMKSGKMNNDTLISIVPSKR